MAAGKGEFDGVVSEFTRRLLADWLTSFCSDPKRNFSAEGFKRESIRIGALDARDFMRALDCGLVSDLGGGRYSAKRSNANEQIFWEGLKRLTPRPITLWREPVITIAALARLHLDYDWPQDRLGLQSKTWAFDLLAVGPDGSTSQIVGEVKKCSKELDAMLRYMDEFCANGPDDIARSTPSRRNAQRKWQALRDSPVPIFWAVGPDGDSRVHSVEYLSGGRMRLKRAQDSLLRF